MNDVRLLPWTGEGGKPCYLDTDGTGYLSRMADTVERVQLGMAGDLLEHAADILADRRATPAQLRFLLARMSEALTDVRRIAESRGARLPESDCANSRDRLCCTSAGDGHVEAGATEGSHAHRY